MTPVTSQWMHDSPSLPHCRRHRVGWGKWQLSRRALHPSIINMSKYEVPNNSNVLGVLSACTWLYYNTVYLFVLHYNLNKSFIPSICLLSDIDHAHTYRK